MSSLVFPFHYRPDHQIREDRKALRLKHWANKERFERMRRERKKLKNEARKMQKRERRKGLKYLHDDAIKPKAQ